MHRLGVVHFTLSESPAQTDVLTIALQNKRSNCFSPGSIFGLST